MNKIITAFYILYSYTKGDNICLSCTKKFTLFQTDTLKHYGKDIQASVINTVVFIVVRYKYGRYHPFSNRNQNDDSKKIVIIFALMPQHLIIFFSLTPINTAYDSDTVNLIVDTVCNIFIYHKDISPQRRK